MKTEGLELIWPVATPVGSPARLGTLCSSNWGISFFFFFFFEGVWISVSLSLSFQPLWLSWSFSFWFIKFSTSLVLSYFHKITWDFLHLVLSWFAHVLCLFSLSLLDLSVGEWQHDSSSGSTSRVLSYTIALNNPLGPKTAPVVETQVSPWQTPAFFSLII